jgi:hypothetical protein
VGTLTSGAADDGTQKYGGTFVVDLSPDASGTFTVSLDPYPGWTLMLDQAGNPILPLKLGSAKITVGTPPQPMCLPDDDNDGIQDTVDADGGTGTPATAANKFKDSSTTPVVTEGRFVPPNYRGDQDIRVCDDLRTNKGVRVETLGESGAGSPATVRLECDQGVDAVKVTFIDWSNPNLDKCFIMTCVAGPKHHVETNCPPSPASGAAAGATSAVTLPAPHLELELIRLGVVVATVVLPEPNALTFDAETLEVTAPAANDTTLTVMTPSGEPLPVAPGEAVTLPPTTTIPTVSTWGLAVLTLVLLVGARIYFNRRRTTQM